jgi:predicted nuclease of predicted toxin-antitoxin system
MMRILANENFPEEAVEALRARGHDVVWIRTDAPGSDDREILSRAADDGRVLITFDKDFGELAFRARLSTPSGIILFRIVPISSSYIAEIAVAVLETRDDWSGYFSVVEENRVRMTPLPTKKN